jgi:hypothetical protein
MSESVLVAGRQEIGERAQPFVPEDSALESFKVSCRVCDNEHWETAAPGIIQHFLSHLRPATARPEPLPRARLSPSRAQHLALAGFTHRLTHSAKRAQGRIAALTAIQNQRRECPRCQK